MNVNIDLHVRLKKVLINFIVPLVALSITLLLALLVIYPLINKTTETKVAVLTNEQRVIALQNKVSALTRLVDYSSVVIDDLAIVNKVLESDAAVPRLLDETQKIALGTGISIDKLNYSYSDSAIAAGTTGTASNVQPTISTYQSVSVLLGGTADYDRIIDFLQTSETAARLINVSGFRFSTNTNVTESNPGNPLVVNFSLDSPYLATQPVTAVDVPISLDVTSSDFVNFINSVKEFKYYEFTDSSAVSAFTAPQVEEVPQEGTIEGSVPTDQGSQEAPIETPIQ